MKAPSVPTGTLTLLLCLLPPFQALAETVRWEEHPAHTMDIDCDGVSEAFFLGYAGHEFLVRTRLSSTGNEEILQFGLAQPSRQDAICGEKPDLSSFPGGAREFIGLYGEAAEGYSQDPRCQDLKISGGECDSITVFFNHEARTLNWWRP